ncbi:hypothetical protein V2J09_018508 [Rumex salicifolius]
MDSYEAARAVFARVQSIDPENAHKIVGYILLQDQAEKEMIRLAFGPENHIHSVIAKARTDLRLSSNTSSATASSPSPPPFSPISSPISISRPNPQHLSLPSPRLAHHNFNPSSSSPSSPSVWSVSASPDANSSLSYAAVLNGTATANGSYAPSLSSPRLALNQDTLGEDHHLQEQQSLNSELFDQSMDLAMSPGGRSDSLNLPFWENGSSFENGAQFHHRRSCSVNDICFGADESNSAFAFKPCHYYTRGFCKNGNTCNFVHGDGGYVDSIDSPSAAVGSPCKFDAFEQYQQELMRTKVVAQQQRLAASQLMAGVNFPYNKLNFLQREAQRSAAAALMMGEDFNKLNRFRMGRNDVTEMGYGDSAPGARQIYLTFPADSTFKEEDVSNYFSIYGPVQDVRIPYQQKRMFGFVTFVYPETVKIILNKGNPHFVCDSRVLVKPYKEKGKLPDKKQQQLDRSEFSSCSSPTGLDYREPFEMHVGKKLTLKLEQEAAWQQAIEFQRRRLMNMQLLDLKNHHTGSPSHASLNQNINAIPENASEVYVENQGSPTGSCTEDKPQEVNDSNGSNGNKEENLESKVSGLLESFDHILPDGLLASPTKSSSEDRSIFTPKAVEVDNGVTIPTPPTNNDMLMMPSEPTLKSRFIEIPSVSSGHGAMGM